MVIYFSRLAYIFNHKNFIFQSFLLVVSSIYYSILFVQTIVIIQTISHIPSQNRLQTNNQQFLSFFQSLINIIIFSMISRHAVVDLANKHICFTCCHYKNPILTLKISFCDEFIFHLLNQY